MKHACEPSLEVLKSIQKGLMTGPSTNESEKKLSAIQKQIARHEKNAKTK
jgi:hypothetical protein